MAESQIAGLFMTPEMYRRQQMQEADQQAVNFARMSPREQASYGFFSAGQGLGQAARTLLGAQDPQLQQITEQQRLLQGLDVSDSDSLMQAARRASDMGNVPLAMQLAQQANQAMQARDVAEQRRLQIGALKETAEERERSRARAIQAAQLGSRALEQSQTMYGAPAPVVRDDEGNLMPGAGVTSRYNITPEIAAQLSMTQEGRSVLEGLLAGQKATRPEVVTLKKGERQFTRDPVSGALTPVALPGQPDAANVGNPIASLLQGGAIHPSIQPLANLYATRFQSMDPEDQEKALATLTTKNNAALAAAQARDDRAVTRAGVDATQTLNRELVRLQVQERQDRLAGRTLTPAAQKDVNEASTVSASAAQNAAKYSSLADSLAAAGGGYGAFTSAAEWLRANTGNQNALTELRQSAARIINESAIKSLPPGPATDKDIQIALAPLPRTNADANFMASFLRGLAKVENINSQINSARADWLTSNNGSLGRASAAFPAGQFAARQGETWADFSTRVARQLAEEARSPLSRAVDQIPGVRAPAPAAPQQTSPIRSRADEIIGRGARQ